MWYVMFQNQVLSSDGWKSFINIIKKKLKNVFLAIHMLLIITTRLTNENNRYDIGDTITTSPTNKTTLLLIYKFINMSVGK